jgi:hypothetical protein
MILRCEFKLFVINQASAFKFVRNNNQSLTKTFEYSENNSQNYMDKFILKLKEKCIVLIHLILIKYSTVIIISTFNSKLNSRLCLEAQKNTAILSINH